MSKKVLVYVLPALGDVLLAMPLVESIYSNNPDCKIDLLVREGTAIALEGNSKINKVITCHKYSALKDYYLMFRETAFRYDQVFSLSASDRAFWCTLLAGRERFSIRKKFKKSEFWKYLKTHQYVYDDEKIHIVQRNLSLAKLAGLQPSYQLSGPKINHDLDFPKDTYVVIHPYPKLPYKLWKVDGWREVIKVVRSKGLKVLLTGGANPQELEYLQQFEGDEVEVVAGKLSLAESAQLIKNSKLYIGVDTGTSHVAASVGATIIVLFGASNISRWAPWPINYQAETPPFIDRAGIQRVANVTVISNKNHLRNKVDEHSLSQCMQSLPSKIVVDEVIGKLG